MVDCRGVTHSNDSLRLCIVVATLIAIFTPAVFAQQKPRVFITDSESWEVVGSAAGSGGTFAASSHGGARPQTAEIIKTFGERCPEVLVNNKVEKADYVVVLDHEGGKGYLRRRNKIAVFNKDGDSIVSRSTRSLGNSVQDGCEAIVGDWGGRSKAGAYLSPSDALSEQIGVKSKGTAVAAPSASVPPKPAPSVLLTGIETSSATLDISSSPADADIEIDGAYSGSTPSLLGIGAGDHAVRIIKKGYAPWERKIRASSGKIRMVAELEENASNSTQGRKPTPQAQFAPQEQNSSPSTPMPLHPVIMKSNELVPASRAVSDEKETSAATPAPIAKIEGDGTVSITSSPDGAEIFVDSIGKGIAPMLLKVASGRHTVQLASKGYKDWTGEVDVKSGSIVNVTGQLDK